MEETWSKAWEKDGEGADQGEEGEEREEGERQHKQQLQPRFAGRAACHGPDLVQTEPAHKSVGRWRPTDTWAEV